MRKPLALLAVLGAVTLALAGCGTTSVAPQDSDAPAAATAAGCADDTTKTSTGPVEVTDAFGRTVSLDKPAERVAVLEWQQIEDALTLCVTPVAVADAEGFATWDTAEKLPEGVTDVGTRQEPNLDTLVSAKPDLVIVEANTRDDAIIGQLEKYGIPVLATIGADAKDPIAQMLSTFDTIAQATGREERAEVVTEEFEKHLKDAEAKVADADPAVTEFVFLDGWVDGGNVALRPYGDGSLVGAIGIRLGLTNAWTGETDPAYGLGTTDIEGMTTIGDATILHTGTEAGAEDDFLTAAAKNPAWASIPAVKEDRVLAFPSGIWMFGGPRSAQQIIDAYVDVITK
ncbi:ABC transporter substrate-binding protein [Microbacterium resistens]|nr:iron-siderophore ABC transporter substrate-binding protein [Microbacterium resistens]